MPHRVFWISLFFLSFFGLLPQEARAQDAFRGVVTEVTQGDQLSVKLDRWTLKARLHGAVCPESGELADIAREWTRERVLDKSVQIGVRGTAAKEVVYGDVSTLPDENNIAIELLEQGLATWTRQYAPTRRDLEAAERRAREAKAGVWGDLTTEKVRLRLLIARMATKAPRPQAKNSPIPDPPATPAASPLTKATPTPMPGASQTALPQISQGRPASVWPLMVGILVAVGCLAGAEWVSRDARRLRHRPTLLSEAANHLTPLKVRGVAKAQGELAVSIAGRIPGIYLHEVTQIFRDGAWRTTYNETDMIPFTLDDGMGQFSVPMNRVRYKPIRVARFYNDIPVEKWHARAYSGDIRTEVFFIPNEITLTLYGVFEPTHPSPLLVIEGDERRLTLGPVQLAMALIVAAVTALLLGGYFMVLSAGLP